MHTNNHSVSPEDEPQGHSDFLILLDELPLDAVDVVESLKDDTDISDKLRLLLVEEV